MESFFQWLIVIVGVIALFGICMLLYWPIKKFLETIYIEWALVAVLSGFMGFILMQQTPNPDAIFMSILDSLALVQIFNVKLYFILLAICPIALLISVSRLRFERNSK